MPCGFAVLNNRRPFRRNSAAGHTRAKGFSAQTVKPDVCRCAALKKKHISSTTDSTNPISRFDGSVFSGTGTLVARSEELNKDTIPTPRFAGTSSTWKSPSPSHAEGVHPQNYMVDQQRLQISELHLDKFSTLSTFSCWKIRLKTEVFACSGSPSEATLWIKEVEMVDSLDDLKSSRSIRGCHFPHFEMLDAKIVSALSKIIQNSYLKKRVSLEQQKAQLQDRFLRGRQIAFMIYEYFRVTGAHDAVLDYADLFSTTLCNDDVQEFDTRWDEILL